MANSKVEKVLVIGLDCCDPVLTFDRYLDDLPTFKSLTQNGAFGVMQSIIPPITVPAWSCMASSKDPGQLGVYGFRNRADWSYDKLSIAMSNAIREPRLWDILSKVGKKSFMLGVPGTFPPQPVNGWMVGCFLTPSVDSNYTYPPELKSDIAKNFGEYMIDAKGYRTNDKHGLLKQIYDMGQQRFAVAGHYMKQCDWDLFWLVDMGMDRIHHGFWQFMDPAHHRYEKGNEFEFAIRDYYRFLDGKIAELLSQVDRSKTAVWIVSDHGAKCMKGGVCFNDWLIREGYLTLKNPLKGPTRFADANIDWSKTKAWGEGGYYGRCFFNVHGREPNGIVPQGEVDALARELIGKLQALVDHQGKPMGTKVYRPRDVYKAVTGTPPDLIVMFGDLDWRSVGSVGNPSIYTFENDTGPDDANHNINGMFVANGPGIDAGRKQISIFDLAPSVLTQMGVPVPADMIGKSLV
jgi:predicted AlkP superfamily phosphohydrolase/phosphomutase